MNKMQLQVQQFHREVLGSPTSPAEPMIRNGELRSHLQIEEAIELAIAFVGKERAAEIVRDELQKKLAKMEAAGDAGEPNLYDAIDAVCDNLFVAFGCAEDLGIDIEPFYDEVSKCNMAKRDPGGEQARAFTPMGKKIKPAGWRSPDIAGVLARVLKRRDVLARFEREPPKGVEKLMAVDWRVMTALERDAWREYWGMHAPGIAWFSCTGCGFPTFRGVAVCDACGDHPEIRFDQGGAR